MCLEASFHLRRRGSKTRLSGECTTEPEHEQCGHTNP